jgi:hypothetical protein
VQKTEQINSQQIPALPDFPRQNTARGEINFRMPEIDKVSGERDCCGGLNDRQYSYIQG